MIELNDYWMYRVCEGQKFEEIKDDIIYIRSYFDLLVDIADGNLNDILDEISTDLEL